jgi:hypothetical protein
VGTIMALKIAVLIAAILALSGAWRVTRLFWMKRYGRASVEQRLEEDREANERRHQDQ